MFGVGSGKVWPRDPTCRASEMTLEEARKADGQGGSYRHLETAGRAFQTKNFKGTSRVG